MLEHWKTNLTANTAMGSDIFLESCLAHEILPATGGMSLGMGGSSLNFWYS